MPFIYVFDANALVNGNNYTSVLSQKMDGDSDFILRRIAGVSAVAEAFSYRDMSRKYVWTPPVFQSGLQADIQVAPESRYAPDSQIQFDLQTVNKAVALSGGTDYLAYIAFQGVKRFGWDITPAPCPYRLRSFTYTVPIAAVNWTRGERRRFSRRIDATGDFELYRILQVNATNVPDTRTGVFNYILYDPNKHQLMSGPVPDSYICDIINPVLTTDPATMPGVFPTPGVLYPRMSEILFDLFATQSTAQGDCWQIIFDGAERIPLDGAAPVYS